MSQLWPACEEFGFYVDVDCSTFQKPKDRLEIIIDSDKDSLRIYYLGNNWKRHIEHIGVKSAYGPKDALII